MVSTIRNGETQRLRDFQRFGTSTPPPGMRFEGEEEAIRQGRFGII